MNAHQLSEVILIDYKTIKQHLSLLTKSRLLTTVGDKYGMIYFLSTELEENWSVFQEILGRIQKA